MQIVTINIPNMFVDAIARLTEQGLYPSRSEAIRSALRDFLKGELEMVEELLSMSTKGSSNSKKTTTKDLPKKIDMRSIRKGWN